MSKMIVEEPRWLSVLRRYLAASAVLHLVWEAVQLPLYTIWSEQSWRQQTFAVVHCTIGDIMIAGFSLLVALTVTARSDWPHTSIRRVWLLTLFVGFFYTLYSEWFNTSIRRSWAYSELMPTVPFLGTGLAPALQWLVVPTIALWFALRRVPWISTQSPAQNLDTGGHSSRP